MRWPFWSQPYPCMDLAINANAATDLRQYATSSWSAGIGLKRDKGCGEQASMLDISACSVARQWQYK